MSSTHNPVQASCSSYDFAVGEVFALRQFGINTFDNRLTGVIKREPWAKTQIAICRAEKQITLEQFSRMKALGTLTPEQLKAVASFQNLGYGFRTITIPNPCGGMDPDCTCGLYAYHDTSAMASNKYSEGKLYGVVRAYGKTILGEKGLRAEQAEIVALAGDMVRPERIQYTNMKYQNLEDTLALQLDQRATAHRDLTRTRAEIHGLPPRSRLYSKKLEMFLLWLSTVLIAGAFPLLVAISGDMVSGGFGIGYTLGLFASVSLLVWQFNKGSAIAKYKVDTTVENNLIARIDKLDKSITDTKLELARMSTRASTIPAQFKVNHHDAMKIAKEYGVPYYKTLEEMLAVHPLTGAEQLFGPDIMKKRSIKDAAKEAKAAEVKATRDRIEVQLRAELEKLKLEIQKQKLYDDGP